jgi:hypothetical protein
LNTIKAIRINPNYCKPYCGIGMIQVEEGFNKSFNLDQTKAIEPDSKYRGF